MGMWPFRRKINRKQLSGGAEIPRSEAMHDAGAYLDPGRHNGVEQISTGPGRRRSRRDKSWMSSKESKKLQRDPERRRTYSFSPGRNDSIRVSNSNRPPVPRVPSKHKDKAGKVDTEKPESSSIGKQPIRASTQPLETTAQDWQRVPTLHKRSAQELARRKSSKKRKEEHDREAEIKAMAAFMPTRPATESGAVGRPMKRESKKMHGGLNRNLQNPSSDISLPLAESIHSSLSSKSEHQPPYVLSAFEMLAPRPTIRYSENPRYAPPERSESKKRRASERIPEEELKSHKRIDDLADDLDASELRVLMERDQKRREKKKLAERIKIEKKLARRQEKQRQDEATAVREGTPPPVNMERGVLGRDVIGLGIGTSAVVTSSKRKGSTASESGRGKRPAETFVEDSTSSANPFHRSASLASEQLTPGSEHSEAVIEVAQVGTVGKANVSPPPSPRGHTRGASSISQIMELAKADHKPAPVAKAPEPIRQASSESAFRAPPQSWTSFFKRSKTKRASTPSSFSNTSRDSMQNGQGPQIGYTPMRSSNIPKRTMSRFREHLPELPLSPPDSRVQSPEADEVPPIRTDYPDKKTGNRASADDPRVRYDTPTSGYRSLMRGETPTSGHRSVEAPSPEPTAALSQSLASIDSEGSWLSGRKGGSKRGSAQLPSHPLRDSASSLQQRYKEYSESTEELGIAEDEYFSRLTPGPDDQHRINRQSAANASSDEEDVGSMGNSPVPSELTKWGAVARHPTVVHREPRAKSREGLLNDFDAASEQPGETPQEMPGNRQSYGFKTEHIEDDEPSIHRASSVDLAKSHVRHISAGSARLLELKKSADGRRMSSG
jgi:hypothetical protein